MPAQPRRAYAPGHAYDRHCDDAGKHANEHGGETPLTAAWRLDRGHLHGRRGRATLVGLLVGIGLRTAIRLGGRLWPVAQGSAAGLGLTLIRLLVRWLLLEAATLLLARGLLGERLLHGTRLRLKGVKLKRLCRGAGG